MSWKASLWEIVRAIPQGKVRSYGAVGQLLEPRLSGLLVGRALRSCPSGVPWWRVVGADGRLPIAKQGLGLELEQRSNLEREGILFSPDQVIPQSFFLSADDSQS